MANEGGWIGVDLDGTLAFYEQWISANHIGHPIPAMVQRVKDWINEGQEVKIFTARVSHKGDFASAGDAIAAKVAIEKWCKEHIGRVLPITCYKDYAMITLYDDRCVQVEKNTGRLIGEE